MTATLTITLGDEVLKALAQAKSITLAVGSDGRAVPGTPRTARTTRTPAASKATDGRAGPYREGSLPAKLLAWAGGRKRPFGVPDLMKRFKIKRGHASMLLAYVGKSGAVKRVGRGEYRAA
jgi:hypothetical protein